MDCLKTDVIIDDVISPTSNNFDKKLFLIEKAFAKIVGSYDNIE